MSQSCVFAYDGGAETLPYPWCLATASAAADSACCEAVDAVSCAAVVRQGYVAAGVAHRFAVRRVSSAAVVV